MTSSSLKFRTARLAAWFRAVRRIAWVVGLGIAATMQAQDLAPVSLNEMVYVSFPTNPNAPIENLRSGMLWADGTHMPLNIVGGTTPLTTGKFTWVKRSPTVGLLTVIVGTAGTFMVRTEVTFTSPLKGTYRELTVDGGNAGPIGNFSLSAVPNDPTPALLNLSQRATLTAGQTVTAGFVVEGAPRRVLIRAIGPGLAPFGVINPAPTPALTVLNSAGTTLGTATAWGGDTATAAIFTQVGAFALPATSKDAALVLTLAPGTYTAQVRADPGGEVLVEVYFVD